MEKDGAPEDKFEGWGRGRGLGVCRRPSKTGKSKGNVRSHRDPERSRKGTNLGVDGTWRQKLEA